MWCRLNTPFQTAAGEAQVRRSARMGSCGAGQRARDGSVYEGALEDGLKQGTGVFTWSNGESYEGSFYKDYRHGSGTYSWPDGSRFTGKFYLNRKEGYGFQLLPDGTTFEGLYHADERFGPGVVTYPDGRQDVGMWYRQWLLRLCSCVETDFTRVYENITPHPQPEHLTKIQTQLPANPPVIVGPGTENWRVYSVDTSLFDPTSLLEDEKFIFSPELEGYSTDSDHLPVPARLRQELDLRFFGRSDIRMLPYSEDLTLQQRMEAHTDKHRFDAHGLGWDITAVLTMSRGQFGPKGPLELVSERLIRAANYGDLQSVSIILLDGKVHPDVADARGLTALLAATVNCNNDVIHMLLDSGADVDKLNDEGMSALAVCSLLYYPLHSLHRTLAEPIPEPVPEVPISVSPEHSQEGDSITLSERPSDESVSELVPTGGETQQVEQHLSSKEVCVAEKLEASERPEEDESPSKDEEVCLSAEDAEKERVEDECSAEAKEEVRPIHPSDEESIKSSDAQHKGEDEEGEGDSREPTVDVAVREEGESRAEEADLNTDRAAESLDTDGQIQQEEQKICSDEEPEAPRRHEEGESPTKDEEDSQAAPEREEEDKHAEEPELTEESPTQASDGETTNSNVAWHHGEDEEESGFSREATADLKSADSSRVSDGTVEETDFSSACSETSFYSSATEETVEQISETPCQSDQGKPADSQETIRKMPRRKIERECYWSTMKLLLERGADPNASHVPMPVLFLAIKAGHVEGVRQLLEYGARTDLPLPALQNGLYPLHVAVGLTGPEGPIITKLLLITLTNPDVKAKDTDQVYEPDKNMVEPQVDWESVSLSPFVVPTEVPEEGGRTALHIACQRDSDYTNARDVVSILLYHKASTKHLWSGHSALSLAIASGNELAVDELLAAGVDPNLPLSRCVGSALCAAISTNYDSVPVQRNKLKMVEKLIKAGANILMPVVVGEGQGCTIGTTVDYAFYIFNQDRKIAHTPYHALSQREKQVYSARRQLLNTMGKLLREAAMQRERETSEQTEDTHDEVSPLDRTRTTEPAAQKRLVSRGIAKAAAVRKPLFKYCYQCGRSAWAELTPCGRCKKVFFCSKTCKAKAWKERHKDECVSATEFQNGGARFVSSGQRWLPPGKCPDYLCRVEPPKHASKTPQRHYHPTENYSFI